MEKNLATEELKQIWNSAVSVAVVVASVAVAILEQRQRRFHARYLEDYDLRFFNLKDTRPRLLFTLIFFYKRNTHVKEKESCRRRRKTAKKQKKNIIQERDLALHQRRKCRDPLKIKPSCSFLVFYLFIRMYLMARTLFFIFLSQTMN